MKRKICILFLIATLFITQSCSRHWYNFIFWQTLTINAGIQKCSIVGESISYNDPIGAQAGVTFPVVEFSEPMSIRAEVNLSTQGAKWEETNSNGRTNLLYANAPLVFRYQTKSGFFGEAGIQPGLLIMAKENGSINGAPDYSLNVREDFRTFDLAIPFGAGYEFKKNFGVSLRVIPGITNINSNDPAKDHNFLVALRGTYTFRLK
jgi:hypothetical protein